MKKAIVISLVVLVLNSTNAFAQTSVTQTVSLRAQANSLRHISPPATEKDFTATYDATIRKTIAMFPDLPSIAIVVIVYASGRWPFVSVVTSP